MEPSSSAEMLAVLGSIKESFFRVLPKVGRRSMRAVRWVARGVVASRACAPSGRAFFQADCRGNDPGRLATGLGRQGNRGHRLKQHLLARLVGRGHGDERGSRPPDFDYLSGCSSTIPTQGHRGGRSLCSPASSEAASSATRPRARPFACCRIRGGSWPASCGGSSSARPFSWRPSNSAWMYRC